MLKDSSKPIPRCGNPLNAAVILRLAVIKEWQGFCSVTDQWMPIRLATEAAIVLTVDEDDVERLTEIMQTIIMYWNKWEFKEDPRKVDLKFIEWLMYATARHAEEIGTEIYNQLVMLLGVGKVVLP